MRYLSPEILIQVANFARPAQRNLVIVTESCLYINFFSCGSDGRNLKKLLYTRYRSRYNEIMIAHALNIIKKSVKLVARSGFGCSRYSSGSRCWWMSKHRRLCLDRIPSNTFRHQLCLLPPIPHWMP